MTEEPRRWLDDASAPDELRADLRAMRDAPLPVVDHAAALAALEARIRSGGTSEAGSPPSGASGALGLAAVIGALAILGGVTWWLGGDDPAPALRPPTAEAPRDPGRAEPLREVPSTPTEEREDRPLRPDESTREAPVAEEDAVVVAPPLLAPEATTGEPALTTETRRRVRSPAEPPAAPPPEPAATADLLRREMELVEEGRRALDRDPSRALAAMDTAQREVGRGTFGDERDAIRVLALFALDRDEQARPLAERLLTRDPDGLYAARIRAALAEVHE